jgi:hypothetical protein
LKTRDEGQKLAISNFVAKCFGIIMVVLYIALGTTIIIKADDQETFPPNYAVIFGVTLILYGFFRAYKVYRNYFSRDAGDL